MVNIPAYSLVYYQNIPAYSLVYYQNGNQVLDSRVIVGRPDRKTPMVAPIAKRR